MGGPGACGAAAEPSSGELLDVPGPGAFGARKGGSLEIGDGLSVTSKSPSDDSKQGRGTSPPTVVDIALQ